MSPTLKQSNILDSVISRALKLTKVGERVAISTVLCFYKDCSSQIYHLLVYLLTLGYSRAIHFSKALRDLCWARQACPWVSAFSRKTKDKPVVCNGGARAALLRVLAVSGDVFVYPRGGGGAFSGI